MFKWIKLIKFVKRHRSLGNYSFKVVTNSDTFIMYVETKDKPEQIRIPYK